MASTIRFSKADLQQFSDVSGDRNPLHMSESYAARTAYGQPVVFGVLGAIACLGKLPLPAGTRLKTVDAEFRRPLFCGVEYRVETGEKNGKLAARLFDGSVQVLAMTVAPDDSDAPAPACSASGGIAERTTARLLAAGEIAAGLEVAGTYRANLNHLPALAQRWGVTSGFDLLEVLALSSYVVGMELPGETALFFRLLLNFEPAFHSGDAPLQFSAKVESVNNRLGYARMSLTVAGSQVVIASGECHAFNRAAPAEPQPESKPAPVAHTANTKVVAVIGASRGLGAAIRLAFSSRGATVFTLSRTPPEHPDPALTEIGDATDPGAVEKLRNRILSHATRLDVLVCNACPPVVPLRLEPNALHRLEEYVSHAVSMTLTPLCAFLDLLDASGGTLIVISSAAVAQPVREWPHYLAAKQAVEALAHTAALQYPGICSLIVRPEKLLTEMVGTPIGRLGAVSPADVAARLTGFCLAGTLRPGAAEIML